MTLHYFVGKLGAITNSLAIALTGCLILLASACGGSDSPDPDAGICMLGYQDISGICVGNSIISCDRFGPDYIYNTDAQKCEGGDAPCPLEGCEISGESCSCEPDQSCPNEECFLNDAFYQCSCPPTGDCDRDGDRHLSTAGSCGGDDCNDNDPSVYFGATEICGDGIDQDCSGADLPAELCDNDSDGYTPADNDCDDYNPDINPGADEIRYNGFDEDCLLLMTPDDDIDGDGYCKYPGNWPHSDEHPENANVCKISKVDDKYMPDCNDSNASVNPGMEEIYCDDIDNDCDGYDYNDRDGDGHHCITESGGDDCDDNDYDIHPGAVEQYLNFRDDDCDINDFCIRVTTPRINPECVIVDGTITSPHGYDLCDQDGDNYYPINIPANMVEWCPTENEPGDCNDIPGSEYGYDINPGMPEILRDGKDNDCDCGTPDDDLDDDGFCLNPENYPDGIDSLGCGVICRFPDEVDCYDDPVLGHLFYPGATEVIYDGYDQDCDGSDLTDFDGDGYSKYVVDYCLWDHPDDESCMHVETCNDNHLNLDYHCDCNDGDPDINPGMADDTFDYVDDNCDGIPGERPDSDGDGWGDNIDCDEENASVNPGASEGPGQNDCNSTDEDCDGNAFDADCDAFDNEVADSLGRKDCDDNHATVYPGAPQVCGDGLANDCDFPDFTICNAGTIDADGDEFATDGTPADCDDTDPNINPDQEEIPYDGLDNDCSEGGLYDLCDTDGDSFYPAEVTNGSMCAPGIEAGDCDDNHPNVFPNAPEICNDRVKNNCLGASMICNCGDEPHDCVDRDNDEYSPDYDYVDSRIIVDVQLPYDCNDIPENNGTLITPNTTEIVYDGIDNDCDAATIDDDLDGDGYLVLAANMSLFDCNDNDDQINPAQADEYGPRTDDDCSVERIDYDCNFYYFPDGAQTRRVIPYDINNDDLTDVIAINSGDQQMRTYFAGTDESSVFWDFNFPEYDDWDMFLNRPRDAVFDHFDDVSDTPELIVCSDSVSGGYFSSIDRFQGEIDHLVLEPEEYPADYTDHFYNFKKVNIFDDEAANPIAVIAADVDGDDLLDVVVLNNRTDNISVLFAQVQPSFLYRFVADPSYVFPIDNDNNENSFEAGDLVSGHFNGDDYIDLVASGLANGDLVMLPGKEVTDRSDLFGETSTTTYNVGMPAEMVAIDLDNDGIDELVVADAADGKIHIYHSDYYPRFTELYVSDPLRDPETNIQAWSLNVTDLNGDNIYDIAVGINYPDEEETYSDGIVILLGEGTFGGPWSGGFEIVENSSGETEFFQVGLKPRSIDHADFNNDDVDDLLVALFEFGGFAITLANTTASPVPAAPPIGDGTFGQATFMEVGPRSSHVVSADFSGDQIADLAVSNTNEGTISLLFGESTAGCVVGCPTGTFVEEKVFHIGQMPEEILIGSINNDHIPDLVTANPETGSVSVLLADATTGFPNGSFSLPHNFHGFTRPTSLAIEDFDDDGLNDLAIVDNVEVVIHILPGSDTTLLGGVRKTFPATSTRPVKIRTLDVNNDQAPDFAVVNCPPGGARSYLDIYINDGSGDFILPIYEISCLQHLKSGYCNTDLIVGDFNEDGRDDLIASQYKLGKVNYFAGNGDGTFQVSYIPTLRGQTDLVKGDFNYDGHLDIAFTSKDFYTVTILLGDGNGNFEVAGNFGTGGAPTGLAAGYFNSDRRLDLAVAAPLLDGIYLLFNRNE
jgi:Putative metal-binding motif/FG-GAP-like repeat